MYEDTQPGDQRDAAIGGWSSSGSRVSKRQLCRMGREENTELVSATSCCIKKEIIPSKVQWKAGLLWRADEVFSILSFFLWEERCLNYLLRSLVVKGCMVFMEKVAHRSLNPVFIEKVNEAFS